MRYALWFALVACGEPTSTLPDSAVPVDAGSDGGGAAFGTCDGPCRKTAVTAMFQATRTLDQGYFGRNLDGTLHVEVQKKADISCPQMADPTPDYTLVIGKLPAPSSTAVVEANANMLDFRGDLLGGALGVGASMKMMTPVAYAPDAWLALDLMLGFQNNGMVTGHLYATHCPSMDE